MMGFAALFCAVGWAAVILGLIQRDWHAIRGGLIYCVTSSTVVAALYQRRRASSTLEGIDEQHSILINRSSAVTGSEHEDP
jgi:hypothetical protein